MGSGRGDRNQLEISAIDSIVYGLMLQWGPVVVTGISFLSPRRSGRSASFNGVRSW